MLLAVLLEGGGSPLPAGLIICAISGWLCFASRILVISRVKAAGSSTSAFRFRQWPVKDNGNEHFSAIFLDEGRPAGLHLCKNCHRLVFTQGAFPFLQGSLRQDASLWWGILSCRCPQCTDEGTVRQRGRRQVCDSSYCS